MRKKRWPISTIFSLWRNVRLEPGAMDAGNRRICLKATLFDDVVNTKPQDEPEIGPLSSDWKPAERST
ncbi:hypothetical protein [Phyllobacterium endophyticum]|uniref:hypothetical protein n=1 Tax=Phyllobacterium endophyticum TaxID=1149773 RepID=UPI0011B25759|nr:hypothetical protein [Phyllobacterium endophyticum]MBB3237059.1 hypothetical protein [Phyllobacterium endophyticum]